MNINVMKNIWVTIICLGMLVACGGTVNQRPGVASKGLDLYDQRLYFKAIPLLEQEVDVKPTVEVLLALADAYHQVGEVVKNYSLINHPLLEGVPERVVISARLYQNADDCQTSLKELEGINAKELRDGWYAGLWQLRVECGKATGRFLVVAHAYMKMSQLSEDPVPFWDDMVGALLQVEDTALIQHLAEAEEAEWRGWLEAAFIQFGADGESGELWLNQWGQHPAAAYFLNNNPVSRKFKVAVLLPFSGRFEAVAKAVQKGLLAAALSQRQAVELVFYDTGSDGERLLDAWYDIQEMGADFIIGPIDKQSISALELLPESTIPMLLLNQSETNRPQFTLSPEGEATDIAETIYSKGHRQVMIMAENNPWGERMTMAFAQRFVDLGGSVIKNQYFDTDQHDFSDQLRQMLGLVESTLRAKNLQSYLKLPINAEEVVRADIDAIFLVAQPAFARLMVPQLKFHHAAKVPVYASSDVFVGLFNEQHNKDLEGVQFSLAPLQLQTSELLELLPFDVTNLKDVDLKLFALGYDAIGLSTRLEWMSRFSSGRMSGLSGELYMDALGHIKRKMQWAFYTGGEIYAVED